MCLHPNNMVLHFSCRKNWLFSVCTTITKHKEQRRMTCFKVCITVARKWVRLIRPTSRWFLVVVMGFDIAPVCNWLRTWYKWHMNVATSEAMIFTAKVLYTAEIVSYYTIRIGSTVFKRPVAFPIDRAIQNFAFFFAISPRFVVRCLIKLNWRLWVFRWWIIKIHCRPVNKI